MTGNVRAAVERVRGRVRAGGWPSVLVQTEDAELLLAEHDRLAAVVARVDLERVLAAIDEAITATVHVASEAEEAKAAVRAVLIRG